MRDIGYRYVSLDCGYSAGSANSGKPLAVDATRFPSGLTALGKQITALGLEFGIYSSGKQCCDGNVRLGMEASDAKQFAEWNVSYVKYDDCGTTTESFVRERPPACVRACVRACLRAFVRACARSLVHHLRHLLEYRVVSRHASPNRFSTSSEVDWRAVSTQFAALAGTLPHTHTHTHRTRTAHSTTHRHTRMHLV